MAHTPGPWTLGTPSLETIFATDVMIGGDVIHQRIAIAGDSGLYRPHTPVEMLRDESRANALLIAAAPELLEALKSTTLWIEEYVLPAAGNPQAVQRFIDKNRAAIAKAESRA